MFCRLVLVAMLVVAGLAKPSVDPRKVADCVKRRGFNGDTDLNDPETVRKFKEALEECAQEIAGNDTTIIAAQNLNKFSFPDGCSPPQKAQLTPEQKQQNQQDIGNALSGHDICASLDSFTRLSCLAAGDTYCGLSDVAIRFAQYSYTVIYVKQQAMRGNFSCPNEPTPNPELYTTDFNINSPLLNTPVDCSQFSNAWNNADGDDQSTAFPEDIPVDQNTTPIWG